MPPKTKPKKRKRPRTKTTPMRKSKTFARKTLDAQTKKINAAARMAIKHIRASQLPAHVKRTRIATIQKDAKKAITYYRKKIAKIQSTGLGLIRGLRASRAMDPHIKKFHIKEIQDNMKHHIAASVQLFDS